MSLIKDFTAIGFEDFYRANKVPEPNLKSG